MLTYLLPTACDDSKISIDQVPGFEIVSHADNETIPTGDTLRFFASVTDLESSIENVCAVPNVGFSSAHHVACAN